MVSIVRSFGRAAMWSRMVSLPAQTVPLAPKESILGLTEECRKDQCTDKLDLSKSLSMKSSLSIVLLLCLWYGFAH
jgi:hypothetical protein